MDSQRRGARHQVSMARSRCRSRECRCASRTSTSPLWTKPTSAWFNEIIPTDSSASIIWINSEVFPAAISCATPGVWRSTSRAVTRPPPTYSACHARGALGGSPARRAGAGRRNLFTNASMASTTVQRRRPAITNRPTAASRATARVRRWPDPRSRGRRGPHPGRGGRPPAALANRPEPRAG